MTSFSSPYRTPLTVSSVPATLPLPDERAAWKMGVRHNLSPFFHAALSSIHKKTTSHVLQGGPTSIWLLELSYWHSPSDSSSIVHIMSPFRSGEKQNLSAPSIWVKNFSHWFTAFVLCRFLNFITELLVKVNDKQIQRLKIKDVPIPVNT